MTLIADTGGLYALYDASDRHHEAVCRVLDREPGSILVPSPVLTELDYLLREFLGVDAELDFLASLQAGAFLLERLTADDLDRCRVLIEQYRDLDLGLVDAAVIAQSERLRIHRILTVDERDFRAVQARHKGYLHLLPADED